VREQFDDGGSLDQAVCDGIKTGNAGSANGMIASSGSGYKTVGGWS
jgi:hypothetical protein